MVFNGVLGGGNWTGFGGGSNSFSLGSGGGLLELVRIVELSFDIAELGRFGRDELDLVRELETGL